MDDAPGVLKEPILRGGSREAGQALWHAPNNTEGLAAAAAAATMGAAAEPGASPHPRTPAYMSVFCGWGLAFMVLCGKLQDFLFGGHSRRTRPVSSSGGEAQQALRGSDSWLPAPAAARHARPRDRPAAAQAPKRGAMTTPMPAPRALGAVARRGAPPCNGTLPGGDSSSSNST